MKTIRLPSDLYNTLLGQLEKGPFSSMDDFVVYILQQYSENISEKPAVDPDTEVKKRLENLGYL